MRRGSEILAGHGARPRDQIDAKVVHSRLWSLAEGVASHTAELGRPVIERFTADTGLSGSIWFVHAVLASDGIARDATYFHRLSAFTPRSYFSTALRTSAAAGHTQADASMAYRLTEQGLRRQLDDRRSVAGAVAAADPLKPDQSARLASIVSCLVDVCVGSLSASVPQMSRHLRQLPAPGDEPMAVTSASLACLASYRFDVHRAVLGQSSLSALELTMLTMLWRRASFAADEMEDTLVRCGHPPVEATAAGQGLRRRGLMTSESGRLVLTHEGRAVRDRMERDTDRLFSSPWDAMNSRTGDEMEGVLGELLALLDRGRQATEASHPAAPATAPRARSQAAVGAAT